MAEFRHDIRSAEVAREFAELQERYGQAQDSSCDDDGDSLASNHAIYHAPWREAVDGGSLGPWYGPATKHGYKTAIDRFSNHRRGGVGSASLFDEDEDNKCRGGKQNRPDADDMAKFMSTNSHEVPRRELEIYCAYWLDGLSRMDSARRCGITNGAAGEYILRLRRRLAKHKESGR